jgi:hypothetical protein
MVDHGGHAVLILFRQGLEVRRLHGCAMRGWAEMAIGAESAAAAAAKTALKWKKRKSAWRYHA